MQGQRQVSEAGQCFVCAYVCVCVCVCVHVRMCARAIICAAGIQVTQKGDNIMPKQVVSLESAVEENLRLRALVQELLQSGLGKPIPAGFTVDNGEGKFTATFSCQSPERFGYREPSAKLGTRPIVCGKRGGQLF